MQVRVDALQEACVFVMTDPAEVRHTANIPQQTHGFRVTGAGADLGLAGQSFQRQKVIRFARLDQSLVAGGLL